MEGVGILSSSSLSFEGGRVDDDGRSGKENSEKIINDNELHGMVAVSTTIPISYRRCLELFIHM